MKRFKLHTQIKKKKYSTYMNNFFDYIKGKAWAYEWFVDIVRQHMLQFIRFKLGRIKDVLFIDPFQATLEIPHYKSESTDSANNF